MPEIRLFGSLRTHSKVDRLTVQGGTVRDMLDALCADNPDLCQTLFNGESLRPFVRITVNGHDVMLQQGLDTSLEETDYIAVFPPIAGG